MNDDDTKVDHPAHYGGADNPHEAIKVIEAWDVRFCLGNALKYLSRAGKKEGQHVRYDLKKAAWYLNRVRRSPRDCVTPLIRRTLPTTMHARAVAAAWGLEPPLAAVLTAVFEGENSKAAALLLAHVGGLR